MSMSSSSARSLLRKVTPYITSRIRENHRILRYSSSSAPLRETSSSLSQDSLSIDSINLTPNFVRRMRELQATEGSGEEKVLRLGVETGGCSGFQYAFTLENRVDPEDRVFEKEGVKLVVDDISYDFVKGATVDYVEELIRSAFVVTENPSAVGGCSCKSSFMVKQ